MVRLQTCVLKWTNLLWVICSMTSFGVRKHHVYDAITINLKSIQLCSHCFLMYRLVCDELSTRTETLTCINKFGPHAVFTTQIVRRQTENIELENCLIDIMYWWKLYCRILVHVITQYENPRQNRSTPCPCDALPGFLVSNNTNKTYISPERGMTVDKSWEKCITSSSIFQNTTVKT